MTAPQTYPPKAGTVLPNGAIVLLASERNGEGVVLARFREPEPYVTWRYHPTEGLHTTGAGHYFNNIAEAARDYTARGGI